MDVKKKLLFNWNRFGDDALPIIESGTPSFAPLLPPKSAPWRHYDAKPPLGGPNDLLKAPSDGKTRVFLIKNVIFSRNIRFLL